MLAKTTEGFARAADPLADCTGTWWVAVTRPRYEARLVKDLGYEDGRTVLIREKVTSSDPDAKGNRRRRTYERPLFPGYVFINGNEDYRYAAAKSLATIQMIEVRDQRRLHRELGQITIVTDTCIDLSTARIEPGDRVRITDGIYVGFEGIVIEGKPGLVHLAVTMMGTCVALEVPREFIEPV